MGKSTVSLNLALAESGRAVGLLNGKKALQYYRRAGVPILGVVENMSGFLCPRCGQPVDIFARVFKSRAI